MKIGNDLFNKRDEWLSKVFNARTKSLPISFNYGGASVDLKKFIFLNESKGSEIKISATDSSTGLSIACIGKKYNDFPIVEWTFYLKNNSTADTPIIEKINASAVRFKAINKEFIVKTNRGDVCTASSYEPIVKNLEYGDRAVFAPVGGRPTSDALPFFNIAWDKEGILMGLGWPGQWEAAFHSDNAGELSLFAGQQVTKLKLHPGEEIRTPLVVMMFRADNYIDSQNIWRQWMFKHNMQKPDGVEIKPFSSVCFGLHLNETKEKEAITFLKENNIGLDYYWTDAGWYGSKGVLSVGTWKSDDVRYPNTFRAVTDYAHEKGFKTVLWFENERVSPEEDLCKYKDKGWIISLDTDRKSFRSDNMLMGLKEKEGCFATLESYRNQIYDGDCLFNLGNDDARRFLTDITADCIEKYNIDCYRTDFNIGPFEFWCSADGQDRCGITENKYVTGFLKFWDELQQRFPHLVFDTCSSGGRRNDLETLRRAVPLLRSDYQCGDTFGYGNQGHTYGLSSWIPFGGTGAYCDDSYLYRSQLTFFMGVAALNIWDLKNSSINIKRWRIAISEWRAVKDCYYGNYYPLTPYNISEEKWIAWQFYYAAANKGMLQAFRRANCQQTEFIAFLGEIDEKADYEFTDFDSAGKRIISGKELLSNGFTIKLAKAKSSALITYKKI